jgi:hypothetical protein
MTPIYLAGKILALLGSVYTLWQLNWDLSKPEAKTAVGLGFTALGSMFDGNVKANQILGFLTKFLGLPYTPDAPQAAAVPPATPPTTTTTGGQDVKKIGLVLLFAFVLSSQAFAWEVSGKPFGMGLSNGVKLSIAGQQVSGVLMPTGALGFSVGTGTPAYGYTGGLDFVLCSLTAGTEAGKTSLTPYLGIGGALNVDFGGWIDSGFSNPVKASGGVNVIGPQIEGLVPEGSVTWNFETGERVSMVGFSAPFGLFEDSTITKIF